MRAGRPGTDRARETCPLSASSTQFPRPIAGKDAFVAFDESSWRDVYRPDCETEILDEVGDDESSAVRFISRARLIRSGIGYENEYTFFARSGRDGIVAVFEGPRHCGVARRDGGAAHRQQLPAK